MDEEVVVSREMLKAINADSRISILKALIARQKTQSELASELKISAPTVLGHMARLEEARLVEIVPEYADKKWKYYRLTKTGRSLVGGRRMSIILILASGSAAITGALIGLYVLLPSLMSALLGTSTTSLPNATNQTATSCGAGQCALSASLSSLETSSRSFLGLAIMLLLILTIALFAIYLIRRKK